VRTLVSSCLSSVRLLAAVASTWLRKLSATFSLEVSHPAMVVGLVHCGDGRTRPQTGLPLCPACVLRSIGN